MADNNFRHVFLQWYICILIQFIEFIFPGVWFKINYLWFRQWLGVDQTPSHYLNQRWWISCIYLPWYMPCYGTWYRKYILKRCFCSIYTHNMLHKDLPNVPKFQEHIFKIRYWVHESSCQNPIFFPKFFFDVCVFLKMSEKKRRNS